MPDRDPVIAVGPVQLTVHSMNISPYA